MNVKPIRNQTPKQEKKEPVRTNMSVSCDKCSYEFKVKPGKVRTKFITNEIEKMYFKCPKCRKEYIVAYRDKEVLNNTIRIHSITRQIRQGQGKLSEYEFEALQNEFEGLKQRNLELSNRYKAIYGR